MQETYFIEAKKWYNQRFLSSYSHKWCMIIILILIMINIFGAIKIYTNALLNLKIPLFLYNDNEDDTHQIKDIFKSGYNIHSSIAAYMLQRYVEIRESYNPNFFYNNQLFDIFTNVQNMSSKQVFNEYMNYINVTNQQSPMLLYKLDTMRYVEINKIVIPNPEQNNFYAMIEFCTYLYKPNKYPYQEGCWFAEVNFDMTNIFANTEKIDFKIYRYQVFNNN